MFSITLSPADKISAFCCLTPYSVLKPANTFKDKVANAEVIDAVFGKKVFKMIQTETGVKGKNLYMPIREALTGKLHGPDLDNVIAI